MATKLKSHCQKAPAMEAKAKGLWPPPTGTAYKVKDGDNWGSVSGLWGIPARNLIGYNFNTVEPPEVNWYFMETDFIGGGRFSQISAGPLAATVLHLFGTPSGVNSVYIDNFKTGTTYDAGGSSTIGALVLMARK